MKKKRAVPVTLQVQREVLATARKGHRVISALHTLNKRASCAQVEKSSSDVSAEDKVPLRVYQHVSLRGESRFPTSRWLLRKLRELERLKSDTPGAPLRLLDVGALSMQYAGVQGISATYLDLQPMRPGILAGDLLSAELPIDEFDCVCLSLVLNFAGDARARGQMLVRARELLHPGGVLYVVLPRACVDNSRYLTRAHLVRLLAALGFSALASHVSPKLAYFLFALDNAKGNDPSFTRKVKLADGPTLNNFCILL